MRFLYSALLYAVLPLALLRLLWRSRREPGYRARLAERFGFAPPTTGRPLWLHAVSVGEVRAAQPLLDALLAHHPGVPLVVSTTTPSGAALLEECYGDRVCHVYMPFDLPGAVRRAFRRLRPRALVILETELWPNLVALAPCPVLLFNARLSGTSRRRYARLGSLAAPMLRRFAHIACQSEDDARRFVALGAPGKTVSVCGNLKAERAIAAAADNLRAHAGQLVLVAGSTHAGEETALLAAFARLRERFPDLLLVLAPRHVTRSEALMQQCRRAGWLVAAADSVSARADVRVVVTLGELAGYYALADIAFVGGSLVERGGHNLLEPAMQGVAVVAGTSLYSCAAQADALLDAGALRTVADARALGDTLGELLADAALREKMGNAGREVALQSRGALAHCLKQLEHVLD